MRALREDELLTLWDDGLARHPIDRALLLASVARPDVAPDGLAALPLGELNQALLRLHAAWFGDRLDACVDCDRCGARLELTLPVTSLLAAPPAAAPAPVEVAGLRFRPPDSRDLAAVVAVAAEVDDVAARLLQQRCCLTPGAPGDVVDAPVEAVEQALEAADPFAYLALAVTCAECGAASSVDLRIGEVLWAEVDALARRVLADVDALARAYGWTEPEILRLTPRRRAAYLSLVGG